MAISDKLDNLHFKIRQNLWLWLFFIFCRISLALGFIPAGMVKILNERFASGLSTKHPMGQYLEALYHTDYYYTSIGIAQVIAAILLLIPRTVTLGAIIYFPIILNICILSFAVRFDGSHVTAPLMVMANLYVLLWNYDRLKFILPFTKLRSHHLVEKPKKYQKKFPLLFFAGVVATIFACILFFVRGHDVMPRNSQPNCEQQFLGTVNEAAGMKFCECIHVEGRYLHECLEEYEKELGRINE